MVSSENETFHVSLTDEITLETAKLFLDDGDWRSTKGILIRSQDILPLNFNTIYITAIVQLLGGEADAAKTSLARLEMLTENNPVRLARMGNLFERVDSLKLADSLYDRALAEDKFSPIAIVGKSNIMKKKGNPKGAVKYLESKDDYIIDNRMVWPRLISLYQEIGDINKARDLMGKLIDIAPENIDRYRKAVELAKIGGSQEDVNEIYEKCLAANPDNEYAAVFAANYFEASGHDERARDLLEKAYSAHVLPDEDLYLLGLISEKEGKLDSAMTLYRKSVEINPMYGNSYGRMAALMLKRDSLDDRALMDFTNFVTMAQRSEQKPEYNFLIGRAQLIQKRYRAASRNFSIALKADASNPEYNFYAGMNYIKLDSLSKARTHLNKALKNGLTGELKAKAEKALAEI
jgi:tetratricopeptide (TPR) repeat protein